MINPALLAFAVIATVLGGWAFIYWSCWLLSHFADKWGWSLFKYTPPPKPEPVAKKTKPLPDEPIVWSERWSANENDCATGLVAIYGGMALVLLLLASL